MKHRNLKIVAGQGENDTNNSMLISQIFFDSFVDSPKIINSPSLSNLKQK